MKLRARIDEEQTLYQAVRSVAFECPDQEALVIGNERLTYHQLLQRLDALAAGLQRYGVQPGERVAVILPPSVESVTTLVAPSRIGAGIVLLNPLLRAHEVRHILADSGAAALITIAEMFGHDYLKMIAAIRPTLPALRHIFVREATPGAALGQGVLSLAELMAQGQAGLTQEVTAGPDDLLGFFYTSGTTGLPKGAVHVQRSLLATLNDVVTVVGQDVLQTVLTSMPLFHYAGILTAVATLCVGGKLVLQERFAPHLTLALLASERATGMVGVPTMYHLMVQVPNLAQFDLSALREVVTGAAPCPPDLIKAVDARMGVKMCNAYGLTESGMLSFPSLSDPDAARIATVGRHMARVELRIVDDQRRSVPAGQPGEIAARTPYALKEYHNRPDATAAVLDSDGWFYTGDVGMLDEQGYLHIMDRKSDMIIRGGINVYPAEIEYFLMTHPGVQMAAIVGVPGSVGGERVWTFIVPKEGATLTAEQILDYCRGQIAAYKVPDEVRFVAELPMTATRKVQKFVLREQAQKEQS